MPAQALPGVRTSERVRTRLHPTTTAGRHCTGMNAQGRARKGGGLACMGSGGHRVGGEWALVFPLPGPSDCDGDRKNPGLDRRLCLPVNGGWLGASRHWFPGLSSQTSEMAGRKGYQSGGSTRFGAGFLPSAGSVSAQHNLWTQAGSVPGGW